MDENAVHSKLHVSIWFHIRVDIPISKPMSYKVAWHHLSELQIVQCTPDVQFLRVEGFNTVSSGEDVLRINEGTSTQIFCGITLQKYKKRK